MISSILATISGVFFYCLAPSTRPSYPLDLDVPSLEFLSPLGHGPSAEVEQFGNLLIATMTALHALDPGIEAALSLVK
jgi:hypothetical protein